MTEDEHFLEAISRVHGLLQVKTWSRTVK